MHCLKKPLAQLLLCTLCLGLFPSHLLAAVPPSKSLSSQRILIVPKADRVSKKIVTTLRKLAPVKPVQSSVETFVAFTPTGEKYALGPAKNNQVLTFIDGKIVWRDSPAYSTAGASHFAEATRDKSGGRPVLSDFIHEPGSGRLPSSSTETRRFGAGGPVPTATTTTISGISQATADSRYVNVSGDTMDGALSITSNGLGLLISGTASGNTFHATRLLTVSGSSIFDGNVRFNSTVTLNNVTYTFPSSDGSSSGKVLKTNAAGLLSWADDDNAPSGLLQPVADERYVNQSGDTMTGALTINLSSGFLGLKIIQTASGNILHVEKDLTSSGTLTVSGLTRFKNNLNVVGVVSGGALQVMNGTSYVLGSLGIGTTSPKAKLEVLGSFSGSRLYAASAFSGAGLTTCSSAGQKLLWNSTTQQFSCATDLNTVFGSGNVLTIGDARYVNTSGDTMTGALTINLSSGFLGLKIIQTASGNILHAEKDLTSSGTLTISGIARFKNNLNVVGAISGGALNIMNGTSYMLGSLGIGTTNPKAKLEVLGSFSGSRLYAASAFSGAGLTTCSAAGQKLLWNSTTQQFSCSTDLNIIFGSGNVFTIGDARYVNTSGDTMTGALTINLSSGFLGLKIIQTASGNILHAEKDLTSSGTLTVSGTARFKSNLNVVGTISGGALQIMNGTSYMLGSLGIGVANPKAKLEVLGSFSGSRIYAASAFSGAGLSSCSGAGQKLLWNSTTQQFSCSTDLNTIFGSGNVFTISDSRYVRTSGGAMTGALTINLSSGFLGLKIIQTASGNILHAEKDLTSSGTLTVSGVARFKNNLNIVGVVSGSALQIMNGTSYVLGSLGVGTTNPKAKLEVLGSFSGSRLYAASAFSGAGLSSCSAAGQKLLWNSSTQQFSCSTDLSSVFGSGNVFTIGDARYVNISGDTMTGALTIRVTNAINSTIGLNVISTISGAVLHAEKTLTSSGGLVFEGAASGSSLYIATSLRGAGLSDCSNTANRKLLWDALSGRFLCAQDQTGSVLTIPSGDARYINTSGDTMTGALSINLSSGFLGLKILQTASGNILHAEKSLSSSGTLSVNGIARFKSGVNVVGTISGSALQIMNGTSTILGSLGIGTTSSKAKLELLGSFSGSRLYAASAFSGAGLTNCGAGPKLLWNSSTQRFECGTDLSQSAGAFGTGNLVSLVDGRYVHTSGGTMTGALTINLSSGFLGLRVSQTASGNILHAEKSLSSSGTLTVSGISRFKNNLNVVGVVSGAALTIMNGTSYALGSFGIGTTSPKAKLEVIGSFSGSRLYAASAFSGAGLVTCSAAGQKLLWNSSTQQFSCSTDLNTIFGSGNVFTISDARYVRTSGGTMTGALTINLSSGFLGLRILQTASGNILHAEKSLSSSGTLTVSAVARLKNNLNVVGVVSGAALNIINGTSYALGSFGIGTTSPKAKLEVIGSFSGSRLYAASAFSGAGLTTCGATQKLLWNSATQQFSCSTDLNTVFGSGNVFTLGDARYVNTSGDSMTGALVINLSSGFIGLKILQTASGNILHAEKSLSSSGTLTANGITRFKSNLNVVGTVSGGALNIMNGTSYVLGSLGIGTTNPKAKLEVLGSFSSSRLYAASAFSGAGLVTCSGAGQKLLWNSTTQQFSCATDLNTVFGSGNVLTIGDARFLRTAGGQMTGALTINLSSGFLGLKILQTASGNILHAEKSLTSSGTLTVSGIARFKNNLNVVGTISGSALQIMNGTSYVFGSLGIGTTNPKAKLEVLGSFSGARLFAASAFSGAGLTNCSAGQKLLWNSSTQRFECSTDLNTAIGSGNVFTISDSRFLRTSGGVMTGVLTIRVTGGNINTLGLNVISTISGAILHAEKTLTSSGGLVFEGSASGSSLYLSSSLQGAGLSDCDNTANSKLLWNAATGRLSCAQDQTGAVLTIASADARYVNTAGDTMTGALTVNLSSGNLGIKIIQTASGNILHAEKSLSSSGTLTVSGTARFKNNLNVVGSVSGAALKIMNGTSYALGTLGIGTTNPKATLELLGSFSGSRIYAASAFSGAGLSSCSGAGQKLLWNSTTQQFSCSTDQTSENFGSGNVLAISDPRYVNLSGDTMTGALTINLSSGFIGLKILQTASGNILHAEKNLTSSGTIIAKNNITTEQGTFITRYGLAFLSGSSLAERSGFNQYINFSEGIGTDSSIRLTSQGNLRNIGSMQAGETLLTAGGTFATRVNYRTGTLPTSVAVEDLDSDGKRDMVVINSGGNSLSVFINTGTGSYATRVNYTTGSSPRSVAIGDLTGDGKPDLAVANQNAGAVSVFRNNGNGTFAAKADFTAGTNPYALSIGDFNGDSRSDLAVVNNGGDTFSILLNTGNAVFAPKTDYATSSLPSSIAATDLNGDGKQDILVTSVGTDTVALFFGLGDGTFSTGVSHVTGAAPYAVAVGDLNSDSKPDFAVANFSSDSVSVFLNTGTGSFASKVDYTTASAPHSVAIGDINGDGLPDLAVASSNDDSVSIFRNLGGGTFTAKSDLSTGAVSHSVAMGDLNNDALADLAVANNSAATVSILLSLPRTILFASASTGGAVGIGLSTPGAKLSVSGTVIVSARGNLTNAKTDSGIVLEVIGTISGTALKLMNNLTVSGNILSLGGISGRGTVSGNNLVVSHFATISGTLLTKTSITSKGSLSGATIGGFGLGSCSGAAQKILYNYSAGKFECGADSSNPVFGTGNFLTVTNARYVNVGGDTMTGALTINLSSGFIGLKVLQTASGNILHAEKDLTSSGTLTVSGIARFKGNLNVVGTVSGGALRVMNGTSYILVSVGIGTTSPKAKLDVSGTISGTTLVVSRNGSFSGALTVVGNTTTRGTLSGANLTVSKSSSISGALLVKTSITSKGSVSGVTIAGFALGSCNGTTQKLLYNNSTQTFACDRDIGLVDSTNSGNVLAIGNPRYVKKQGDTMTGALIINLSTGFLGLRVLQMASGSILHAEKSLTSSGLLMVMQRSRQGSGALVVEQRTNATGAYITSRSVNNPVLVLDSSTGSFKAPHILFGTNGFFDVALWRTASTLNLSGHLLPGLTNKFDLGSSTKRWRSLYLSGGTMYIGTAGNDASINYNTSASLFGIDSNNDGTNELSILSNRNIGIGTSLAKAKLDVVGTISGTTLVISRNASFSGSLTVVGSITSRGSVSGSTISGFSLGSCSDSSASKLLYNYSTQKFECGSDYDPTSGFASANILTIGDSRYVKKQGDTMTGTLKSRGYLLASGTTLAEMSGWNEYLNLIHSGLGTNSVTRLSKDGDLVNIGTIQSGEAHFRRGRIFAPTVDYETETLPESVAIGDLNGDGKADMAAPNFHSNTVSVFIGTGAGLFVSKVDYPTGTHPWFVAIGDLNGDGKADLAIANQGSSSVSILLNNGNGTFRSKIDYTTGESPFSLAIGDLNGDGKPDLAVANANSDSVSIFLNNGNGTFVTKVDYTTGSSPHSIAIGDLNGDGKPDLAIANQSSTFVSVFINNGNGTFVAKVDYTTGTGPYSVAISDLNGDGKSDLAVANNGNGLGNTFSTLLNNGNGIFGAKVDYTTGTAPSSLAIGDLNGDGKPDLAVANQGSSSVSVFLNNSNGTFATKVDYTVGSQALSVAIGDLNGDGKADLAVARDSPYVSVFINISKSILFASSGTGGAVGIGTSTPGSILSVSGSMIISNGGNLANARTDSGVSLEVAGTASGRVLRALTTLSSSGSVIVEGTISGATIRLSNLGVCNTTIKKLVYNTTTNNIECANDDYAQQFGTGQVLTIGDANALRKSGGTMSGALVINLSSGFLGLKVINTASGNIIHAEKDLTSSGTLTAVGVARLKSNLNVVGTISGATLKIMNGTSYILGSFGIGMSTAPKAKLDILGTISGATLTISGNGSFSGSVAVRSSLSGSSFYGAGLGDCNNSTTSKVIYNNATGKFGCASDRGDTSFDYQNAAGTFVNQSGDTMTGALTINLSSGFLGLKVLQTASGNIIHAEKDLTSSGTLTTVGIARLKSNLNAVGTISGGALTIMNGTSYIRGALGIGISSTPKAKLEVSGTISGTTFVISKNGSFSGSLIVKNNLSGSSFFGAGLGDCTGTTTQKLLYNNATGKFSCGSDDLGTAGLTYASVAGTFVNQSGDTMTGALTINLSSGYLGLKVLQTASGNILHAEKNFTSSGTIIAGTDILSRNGTMKTKGYVLFSGATLSEMSGFNEYVNIIHSGLGTNSVTRLTNQGDLKNIGTIQAGEANFRRGGIFAPKVDYTTGTFPASVAIGDLNGDGKGDLAVVNSNSDTISVFIGTGSGLFVAKVDYTTGSSPASVAIGDLNSDGKPDLVASNNSSHSISILLNNGNGTFASRVDYSAGSSPDSVTIGDLNGDGKADLATANFGGNSISVFLNNGNGTFTAKADYTAATGPFSIALGDLNGDGKFDLATANYGIGAGNTVSVFLNNGNGTFAAKVDYTTGSAPYSIAIGDLNGDGKADLAVANLTSTSVSILLNNGNGTFASKVDYATGASPASVRIGDLNADGKAELAVANNASNSVSIFINNGNGTFASKVDYTTGTNPYSVVIGDLNGDGKADLIVTNSDSNTVSVLLNISKPILYASSGTGGAVGIGTSTPGSILSVSGAMLINRGGNILNTSADASVALEVIGTMSGTNLTVSSSASISGALLVKTSIISKGSVSGATINGFNLGSCSATSKKLLYNNSTQKFECGTDTQQTVNFGSGNVLTLVDARYLKIQGGTMTGALTINLSSGYLGLKVLQTASGNILHAEKSLSSSGTIIAGTDIISRNGTAKTKGYVLFSGATLSEMSGFNEYVNIIHSGLGTNSVTRLTNQGDLKNIGTIQSGEAHMRRGGTFAAKVDYTTGTQPFYVAIGDLSGDGKGDLAVVNDGSNTVSIFIGTGSGLFVAKVDYTTGASPSGVAISDLNGDGKADLAVTNSNSTSFSVFLNNGNGTFASKVDYTTGATPRGIAASDLNGDGKADLAVTNSNSTSVSVFLNNGNGTFASKVDYTTGTLSYGIAISDLNGDAKPDLAVTNYSSASVSIFLNNGNGTFASKVDYTTGTSPAGVAISDLNGDGKPDLAVAAFVSTSISVFLNNGNGTFAPKVDYTAGASPYGVAISDLNGDEKLDLAVSTISSPYSVAILLNNGNGTFASKVNYTTGTTPYSVAIGELNSDGKADLAVANYGSASVSVFLNISKSILYASSGTGGAVGIGTSTPGSALAVSGAVIINRGGNLLNTSADAGITLEVVGTASGRIFHAQDVLRSSGSLIVEGNMSGATLQGAGLASCNTATTKKLLYNNSTKKFECGSDTAGSFGSGNVLSIGDSRYVRKSGSTMTGALTINLSSGYLGLKVLQTVSGSILHAEKSLSSSGTIIAGTDIISRNGTAKTKGYVLFSGATLSEMSGFNEYVNIIHSGLGTNSVTRLTNQGDLKNIGTIQSGEAHFRRGGIFAPKVDYVMGDPPGAVSIGDLNGDGRLDLAVENGNVISVFINTGTGSFATKVDYATAGGGTLALGDLNGDGKLDIASPNYSVNSVSVLLNNGNGTFAPKVDYATGSGPRNIAIGDLNGDGKPDLAIANHVGDSLSVLLNNGNGTFAAKVDYSTVGGHFSIAIGDLNGDGKADLAAPNSDTSSVSVLLNNGNGTFAAKVDYTTGSNPYAVSIGDVNGDGKADLAIANGGADTFISILLNNGNGTFATKVDYTTATSNFSIVTGDLNGDGKADLAVVSSGKLSILLNKGNGTFEAKVDYTTGSNPQNVAIGDMNNDGMPDLATSNNNSSSVSVFLNISKTILYASSGTGGAVGIGTSTPGSALSVSGAMIINRNGRLTNTSADAGITFEVVGTASGNIFHAQDVLRSSGSLIVEGNMSGATLQGAGLASCNTTTTKKLLYNNSTKKFECGTDTYVVFGSGNVLTIGNSRYLRTSGGTMTGALTINLSSGYLGLKVLQTVSGSILHAEKSLTSSGNVVAALDIIAKGTVKTDAYVLSSGSTLAEMSGWNEYANLVHSGLGTNSVVRLTNQGDLKNIGTIQSGEAHFRRGGIFAPKVDYATGTVPRSVAIGDLNGDGKMDMAVANQTANTLSVFIGTGSGLFVAKVDYAAGTNSYFIAIGDLNGDGKPDLAVTNLSNSISIFLNNGNGTFQAKVDYATGGNAYFVAIGDLNGDGKADLAVTNNTSTSVSVFLNNGNGTFQAKVDYTTVSFPFFVAIGDLNGDGKADLVVTNSESNSVSIFLNNGNGTFQAKVDFTTGTSPRSVAIGDLNGDGKADLAVANFLDTSVSIFVNNGNGTFAAKVDYTTATSPLSVAIGDLNGDGKADLAVANSNSYSVSVFLNNGNGTFASKVDYMVGDSPGSVAIRDLNGDGKIDMAVANTSGNTVSILLNISKTILYASSGTGGAVGIGTSTPGSALSVSGAMIINRGGNLANARADAGITLEVIGTASGRIFHANDLLRSSGALAIEGASYFGSGLTIKTSHSNAGASEFTIISDYSTSNNKVFRISASGAVYSDATYNSNGADYAEWFRDTSPPAPLPDGRGESALELGEVVCIDILQNNSVRRCERSGDPNVMGIVSSNPAFVGNVLSGADGIMPPGYALIGLIGQVPAKPSLENGPIHEGDSVTSASEPGFIRKASAGESTVGVALEPFDGAQGDRGTINILISRRNQSLTVETLEQKVLNQIASMNLSDQISRLVHQASNSLHIEDRVTAALNRKVETLDLTSQVNTIVDRRFARLRSESYGGQAEVDSSSGQSLNFGSRFSDTELSALAQAVSQQLALGAKKQETVTGSMLRDSESRYAELQSQFLNLESEFFALRSRFNILSSHFGTGETLHAAALSLSSGATLRSGSGQAALRLIGPMLVANKFSMINSQLSILSVSGSSIEIGSLFATGSLKVIGDITITGLATFLGDVHIKGDLVLSSRQAGFAVIPATGTAVTVTFSGAMVTKPIVIATPSALVRFGITAVSATGFTIRLKDPAPEEVRFSFVAYGSDNPSITLGTIDAPASLAGTGAPSLIPALLTLSGTLSSIDESMIETQSGASVQTEVQESFVPISASGSESIQADAFEETISSGSILENSLELERTTGSGVVEE